MNNEQLWIIGIIAIAIIIVFPQLGIFSVSPNQSTIFGMSIPVAIGLIILFYFIWSIIDKKFGFWTGLLMVIFISTLFKLIVS